MTPDTFEQMIEKWRGPSKSWLPDCGAHAECATDAKCLLARLRGLEGHSSYYASTHGSDMWIRKSEVDAILGKSNE